MVYFTVPNQNWMIRNRIIRSLLAGSFLLLFFVAVSPKIAIHALVANHTDTHVQLAHGDADQLNTFGFHCATDELVVESPFVQYSISFLLETPCFYVVHLSPQLEAPYPADRPIFGLRGPPVFPLS
jgi:hypothetical protein